MMSERDIEAEMMERVQERQYIQDCIKEAIHIHEQNCHKE